jgi:PAS domain S-box-containing protein
MMSLLKNSGDRFFTHIIDNIKECLFVIDSSGNIIASNKRALTFFKFSESELKGKNITDLLKKNDFDILSFINKVAAVDNKIEEIELKRKDKTTFWASLKSVNFSEFESNKFFIYISDITKKIEYRHKLFYKIGVLDKLGKSRKVRTENLAAAVHEVLKEAAITLNAERVNAWTINHDFSRLDCLGNYKLDTDEFVIEKSIYEKDAPNYFKLLQTKEVITSNDVLNDSRIHELIGDYIKPNNILSMIDIPLRKEGEMIGVLCFEETVERRDWEPTEQKFAMLMGHFISIQIETDLRIQTQKKLLQSLDEKEVLIREIQHRVKNNLAVISSLINLQKHKSKDGYHSNLFKDCQSRLQSISVIHEMLYHGESYTKIDLKEYLEKIISNVKNNYFESSKNITITEDNSSVSLDITKAIPVGLMVNELLTNSFKHAFEETKKGEISISMHQEDKSIKLKLADNGKGFDFEKSELDTDGLGISLINSLLDQIDGKMEAKTKQGSEFNIEFEA